MNIFAMIKSAKQFRTYSEIFGETPLDKPDNEVIFRTLTLIFTTV